MVAVAVAEVEVAMVVCERGREDLPTWRSTSGEKRGQFPSRIRLQRNCTVYSLYASVAQSILSTPETPVSHKQEGCARVEPQRCQRGSRTSHDAQRSASSTPQGGERGRRLQATLRPL